MYINIVDFSSAYCGTNHTVSKNALGRGTLPRHVMALGRATMSKDALGRVTVSRDSPGRGILPRHVMELGRGPLARHRTRPRHRV